MRCPVCQAVLEKNQQTYICENRHTFDISSKGYVNLLLANKKKSKFPGDEKGMVEARHRFLGKGFYDPLVQALDEMMAKYVDRQPMSILDAGCGEGYYLANLKQFFKKTKFQINYSGLDIAKYAIQMAAARDKEIDWCVGNVFDLPILDRSQDIVLNIFSPYDLAEFKRVLRARGLMVFVTPGDKHLWELKKIIYGDNLCEKENTSFLHKIQQDKGILLESKEIIFKLNLEDRQDILDLLRMTPYYWNIGLETKSKIENLNHLITQIQMFIYIFKFGI